MGCRCSSLAYREKNGSLSRGRFEYCNNEAINVEGIGSWNSPELNHKRDDTSDERAGNMDTAWG